MEKYTRADNSKPDHEHFDKNEIRVTTQGKMRRYISYATSLLTEQQATPVEHITLKAMGKAINKTVAIAEIIKRRIPALHQITEIDSTNIQEVYNPNEEGLDVVQTTRHVSSIMISLFTKEPNTTAVGYQPPIDANEVKPLVRKPPKIPKADNRQTVGYDRTQSNQDDAYAPSSQDNPPRSRNGPRGGRRGRRGGRGYSGYSRQQYPRQDRFGGQQGGYDNRQERYDNRQGGYDNRQERYDNRQGGYENRQGYEPQGSVGQSGYAGQGSYGQGQNYAGQSYGQGYHRGGRRGGYSTGRRGGFGGRRTNQNNQNNQQPQ